jgi:hypothetical protein
VNEDQLVERLARAMNGPWDFEQRIDTETLDKLRGIKWKHLSSQEQGMLRSHARAVLSELSRIELETIFSHSEDHKS